MESNRSRFRGAALPVENVSWEEAVRFCARLAIKSGRAYGLPSEAQWEYACRAGTNTAFCYGPALTTDLANYNGEFSIARAPRGVYRHTTTPVGSFPPNAFGLHDLHGNVWEWCADTWHESYDGAPPDERPWRRGGDESRRVARGGSWHDTPEVCRSAVRLAADAAGDDFIGLRVALTGPL